jgi:hypothetical protein
MASPGRILPLALFNFHNFLKHTLPKVCQGAPNEAYVGFELKVLVALSLCLTLVLPPPSYLQPQSFATCRILQLIIFLKMGVSKNGSVDQQSFSLSFLTCHIRMLTAKKLFYFCYTDIHPFQCLRTAIIYSFDFENNTD